MIRLGRVSAAILEGLRARIANDNGTDEEERDGTKAPPVARAAEDGKRCAGGKVARSGAEEGGNPTGLSSRAGRSEADGEWD